MAVIYKATNTINGKAYIGFAVDFEKRMNEHKKKALRNDRQYFHNALRKYGFDAFEWTVLKENAILEDEIVLIKEHDTYKKGYNLTRGGEGKLGYKVSETTKQKLSEAGKKRKPSAHQLKTLRENAQIMREQGHTEEAKRKISKAHKGIPKSEKHKRNISKNHAAYKETGAYYQSPEYKEKQRKSQLGKTRTPEQKERYRQAALKREKAKREQQ